MQRVSDKNPETVDAEDEVVCVCSGTTRGKIIQLIEDGADSVDRISRITGAVSGCASCDVPIQEILVEYGKLEL